LVRDHSAQHVRHGSVPSPKLSAGFRNRWHAEGAPRQGNVYRWLAGGRKAMPKEPRTPVFLLNTQDFFRGAAPTSIFGMDGV